MPAQDYAPRVRIDCKTKEVIIEPLVPAEVAQRDAEIAEWAIVSAVRNEAAARVSAARERIEALKGGDFDNATDEALRAYVKDTVTIARGG